MTVHPVVSLPGTPATALATSIPVAVVDAIAGIDHHAFDIDPDASDTAAFSDRYGWPGDRCANTIVVAGKRGDAVTYAACVVLASCRLDVNRAVKKTLDVRKASFAAAGEATSRTGMEFGAVTPFGLPADWPILVDHRVVATEVVVVGAGARAAKLVVAGSAIATLPTARVITDLGLPR
ncbi:YbaK/EbsC family protein [Nocardia sp. CNY236]|uniref:YbaK/EbsC family protein n=1 Tax=Nocardia sp. CNY236 TaxID=1169152 RepID=UPI0018CA0184|nr:YbaK/EbsC family protein [Nocardia sp. CNY236]